MRLTDLTLMPFEIEVKGASEFTLLRVTPILTGNNAGQNKEVTEGYFTSIESVVKKVVNIKVVEKMDEGSIKTLQQWLTEYAKISLVFTKMLDKAVAKAVQATKPVLEAPLEVTGLNG